MKTRQLYIVVHWNEYSKDFGYTLQGYKPSPPYITMETRDIEFETWDDRQLRAAVHKALLQKRQQVLADASVEAKQLLEQANELLAIEDHSNGEVL